MRQTNIYDFINDDSKDWIDKEYIVWKAFSKGEWTEYSPKFLTYEDATEWRVTKGEQLCDMMGRKLKRFTCRPADNESKFTIHYIDNGEEKTKLVPGYDFQDACDNLILFLGIDEDALGFKNND